MHHSKFQFQKRLNISSLSILLKNINENILGYSLQGKLRCYLTNF